MLPKAFTRSVKKIEIYLSIAPDHSAIYISLSWSSKTPRGPSIWKFNNTLLNDEQHVMIQNTYTPARNKYRYLADKLLFWEMMKMAMRKFKDNGQFQFENSQNAELNDFSLLQERTKKCITWSFDVSVFEKLRFRPSTLHHLCGVFKFLHSGGTFRKAPYSVTKNAVFKWTVGQTGEKKVRFEIYRD